MQGTRQQKENPYMIYSTDFDGVKNTVKTVLRVFSRFRQMAIYMSFLA